MRIDFGRNTNDGIGANPSRTIGSTRPHIISLKSGTEMQIIGFRQDRNDVILQINTRSFNIFNIGTYDFADRGELWHGAGKCES